jgi:hypothetical protein
MQVMLEPVSYNILNRLPLIKVSSMGRFEVLRELDTDIRLKNISFKDGRDRLSLITSPTKNPGYLFPKLS